MADSILRDKAKEFAKTVVFLCRDMKTNHKESVLINQFLRSATSIGANLHEAQYAQGTKDFISKLEIAQKECYETDYWLELLFETNGYTKWYDWNIVKKHTRIINIIITTIFVIFAFSYRQLLRDIVDIQTLIYIILCGITFWLVVITPIHEILHLIPLSKGVFDNKCYYSRTRNR